MKKFYQPFFSMTTTGVLLVVFAIVIAVATFVENDYGTTASKVLVYNAKWFEVLLFLLAFNLTGSVFVNRLLTRKKWPIAMFHFAFVIILLGAGITRFYAFEGTLHIREGSMNNQLLSRNNFIQVHAQYGEQQTTSTRTVRFVRGFRNRFHVSLPAGNERVHVELKHILHGAMERPVDSPDGTPLISLMAVDDENQRVDFYLKEGESRRVGELLFSFGDATDTAALLFSRTGDSLVMVFPDTLKMLDMMADNALDLAPGEEYTVSQRTIYQAGEIGFVMINYYPSATLELYEPENPHDHAWDALVFEVTKGELTEELAVFGLAGVVGEPASVDIGGASVKIQYGALIHHLPFYLYLEDFQLDRHPGSNSPSSFASEVVLLDPENKVEMPYRIFMNNILKYGGYRFFQAHYDPDEKGTILSVNYDAPGTRVTYIGYLFMTVGMLLTFFFRKSRFRKLSLELGQLKKGAKHTAIVAVLLMVAGLSPKANAHPDMMRDQPQEIPVPDRKHANAFARIQIQKGGRVEPVNTLSSELLRKISRKNQWNNMTPTQVMLSMMIAPEAWKSEPLVRVGSNEIAVIVGVTGKYASFNDFLDPNLPNGYKLSQYVEKAYEKAPNQRTRFDKEIINVDERVNILYKMLLGGFLTVFPVPGDVNNKWVSLSDIRSQPDPNLAVLASTKLQEYLTALTDGLESGDYGAADAALGALITNQKEQGVAVYPSESKTTLEIFYINFRIYHKMVRVYLFTGLILLIWQFVSLLSARRPLRGVTVAGFWWVAALFAIHTAALTIRWYISGHAPWSNGYETLLYISWGSVLAGLIFAGKSPFTLAMTVILAAIALFVAGLSWMNPAITPLVPVLQSYWLIIHVAVITASYSYLGIGALLGMLSLVLFIIANPQNRLRINLTTKELSYIIEMSLIIGLYMLTIGSFLGGVWANESWGRYWGWDPKETWAMVTILVYAFITHMHKIPGLRGEFALSTAALLGFSSVLMTYFGVNYYLSGLHSYAQGDPPPIPAGVYVALVVIVILVITSGMAVKQWKRHEASRDKGAEE
jgi:cytochrome c-type biogenesis protein CcsB